MQNFNDLTAKTKVLCAILLKISNMKFRDGFMKFNQNLAQSQIIIFLDMENHSLIVKFNKISYRYT